MLFFMVGLFLFSRAWALENPSLTKIKDLNFLESSTGGNAVSLSPNLGAQFTVLGHPNGCFEINLPPNFSLTNGNSSVSVRQWVSVPGPTGKLGPDGRQTIFVGATHETLPFTLPRGAYSASFILGIRYCDGGALVSTTALVKLGVIASLSVSKIRDMRFRTALPLEGQYSVSTESMDSAAFLIQGEPNREIQLRLPDSISVSAVGSAKSQPILIRSFRSTPLSPMSLGAAGTQTIAIGATRDAIPQGQADGQYTGTYHFEISYQ